MWSALLLTITLLPSAHGADWTEIYEADGISVSRARVEGSRFVGFRGETVIEAELGRVLYVLTDSEHRTEWVHGLYEQRILDDSVPYETVLYQAFDLPAPFGDRDFVVHGRLLHDPGTGRTTLTLRSVEHADAPPTVGIRAELTDSRYVLTPEGPGRTRVVVEIHSDPAGWMPAWLVNAVQRTWPVETLQGVRDQLDEPWVGVRDPSGAPASD